MKRPNFGKSQKPLFAISGPVKARAYRSNFRPLEATRFLDARKLKTSRKVSLEVGTVEAAGRSATLVAQIHKGMITRLGLQGCANCPPRGKARAGKYKKFLRNEKVFLEIAKKAHAVPGGLLTLPIPLKFSSRGFIRIPIGPIIIVIETDPEICIMIQIGDHFCILCFFDLLHCGTFPPP